MLSAVYVWKCCSHTNDTTPMATSAVMAAMNAKASVMRVVYEKPVDQRTFSASSYAQPARPRPSSIVGTFGRSASLTITRSADEVESGDDLHRAP